MNNNIKQTPTKKANKRMLPTKKRLTTIKKRTPMKVTLTSPQIQNAKTKTPTLSKLPTGRNQLSRQLLQAELSQKISHLIWVSRKVKLKVQFKSSFQMQFSSKTSTNKAVERCQKGLRLPMGTASQRATMLIW